MSTAPLRVALRADASARSGLGHIKRCAALASSLREAGAQVTVVTRDLGLASAVASTQHSLEHRMLRAPSSAAPIQDSVPAADWAGVAWREDAIETTNALREWQPHWVVVDHYSFDARWHDHVRDALNARLAAIDDLADRDLACELLIDHNLHEDHRIKYAGRIPEHCAVLGGPRYALLGSAYARQQPHVVRPQVDSIGIFMGGVDAADLTSAALRACRDALGYRGRIEIAATTAYPHLEAVVALARAYPDTAVLIDLPDLAAFFARHDLQIGAGGGAMWERCCIGAPTLALLAAVNQQAVIPALVRLGAAAAPDPMTATDISSIARALRPLLHDEEGRRALSMRSRALVDGVGSLRAALRMMRATLAVRSVTSADAAKMYTWRNHPTTRQMSRNPSEIAWPQHAQWLEGALADPGRSLLMAHVGNIDVGVIRFDRRHDGYSEVSLYLDPALHGLGLGSAMLLAGERRETARAGGLRGLVATVMPGNAVSERLFRSCGYEYRQGVWRKDAASLAVNTASSESCK